MQQTITINIFDPASPLAPGIPGTPDADDILPQLGASLFNLASSHTLLLSLLLLAAVLAIFALSTRARVAGGGNRLNAGFGLLYHL